MNLFLLFPDADLDMYYKYNWIRHAIADTLKNKRTSYEDATGAHGFAFLKGVAPPSG